MLKLTENMTIQQISLALETARLAGLASETAQFPAASEKGDTLPAADKKQLGEFWKNAKGKGESIPPVQNPDVLFDTDFRTVKGLENIFREGEFLKDTDHDFFPDRMDVRIKLPHNPSLSQIISACNVAFRLGMETVAFEGDILADDGYCGNMIEFAGGDKAELVWEKAEYSKAIFYGDGKQLEQLSALVCEKFPTVDCWQEWRDVLCTMTDSFAMKNTDGQLAYLESQGENKTGCTAFVSPETQKKQKDYFADVEFCNFKEGKAVYTKKYDIPWEVDTFENILETELYPQVKKGDKIEIYAALSEEQQLREKLTAQLSDELTALGAQSVSVQFVDAYKQGLSWVKEYVIPQLKSKSCDKLEIYFKPFLQTGQTEWSDENGATPNKTRTLESTPDKWFDLPVRYLQELYPVEDIIVNELGLKPDNVVFKLYDGSEDITYLCKAYRDNKECHTAQYKALCSERPFIDCYPQLGLVHPSTGYIKAVINGETMVDKTIKTDLENLWDIYQEDVLPQCRKYVEEKYGDEISPAKQPFFQKLHLDITLSETEYRTGSREDMVSPLNALQEDLYFTGTDYFKYLGQEKGHTAFDAPGLIFPDIHKGEGKPVFKVTFYDLTRECPQIEKDGKILAQQKTRDGINLYIQKVETAGENLAVTVRCEGVDDNVLESYAKLLAEDVLTLSGKLENTTRIDFAADSGKVYSADCIPTQKRIKDMDITDVCFSDKEVIGYEEYISIIHQLERVKGLEVFPVATSYEGRTIYAIWFKKPHKGYLSMTKYLTNRSSEYINARHHANEVSSTNSAFMLIRELLTNPKYADLDDKLSLVIIPVENVDGTAIHYTLQKENPNWKHHTSRFNAIGKEFCGECYTQDPVSTEALAATRVYRKFIPDIMVDNHGVPSHEWEQQFSGYTSPAYRGFWLPRALLYGYYWYAKEDEYACNIPLNKKMEDVIADAIAEDKQIAELNSEWAHQFEKYAHRWMPKLFPASYYKGMINYWIPFPHNPKHIYAAVRYPWVTGVAYTSEVADETAQGDYLALCAKAHYIHDIATIDMILSAQHNSSNEVEIDKNGGICAECRRIRPMNV